MLAPTPLLRPSPLDISGLFAGSFEVLKRRLGLFVLIALLPSLVALVTIGGGTAILLTDAALTRGGSSFVSTGVLLGIVIVSVGALLTVLAQLKAQGMAMLGAYEVAQGHHPDVRGLLHRTRGFLPKLAPVIALGVAAVAVVYGVVVAILVAMVGALDGSSGGRAAGMAAVLFLLLLALVPLAVFLGVKLLYTVPAVAIEQLGGIEAMKRSWRLTRGAFWRTLGYNLLARLAVGALASIVSFLGQLAVAPVIMANRYDDPSRALAALAVALPIYLLVLAVSIAVSLVTEPFLWSYTAYMFIDQVRRSEMPSGPAYASPYGPAAGSQGGYYAPPGQYYGQTGGYPPPNDRGQWPSDGPGPQAPRS